MEQQIHPPLPPNLKLQVIISGINPDNFSVKDFLEMPLRPARAIHELNAMVSTIIEPARYLEATSKLFIIDPESLKEWPTILYLNIPSPAAIPNSIDGESVKRESNRNDSETSRINLKPEQPIQESGIPTGHTIQI
jgi:hypothetical protein